jgi:hypothetical protein
MSLSAPGIAQSVRGVRFIAAAVESAKRDAAWVALDDMQ